MMKGSPRRLGLSNTNIQLFTLIGAVLTLTTKLPRTSQNDLLQPDSAAKLNTQRGVDLPELLKDWERERGEVGRIQAPRSPTAEILC